VCLFPSGLDPLSMVSSVYTVKIVLP
jgi:hypothetical protein